MDKLRKQLAYSKKQTSFAWAKHYESQRDLITLISTEYHTIEKVVETDVLPEFVKEELKGMMVELKKKIECPVCYEEISPEDVGFTSCGHKYCSQCLDRLKTSTKKCALCNRKIAS